MQARIRTRLYEYNENGHPTSQVIGEVIVDAGPPARIEIVTPDGTQVFSAPLEVLAWQLCLMEPQLAQFLPGNVKGATRFITDAQCKSQ